MIDQSCCPGIASRPAGATKTVASDRNTTCFQAKSSRGDQPVGWVEQPGVWVKRAGADHSSFVAEMLFFAESRAQPTIQHAAIAAI